MIRFLADENFHNDVLRGVRLIVPDVDIIRVQDTEIAEADDPTVLEWAAQEERILLTHDVQTMIDYAYQRIATGLPVPGVFIVKTSLPIGLVIDELVLVIEASDTSDWANKVIYLPVR